MTTEQTTKLEELRLKYATAKANYDAEKIDNYNFRQGWISTSNNGGTIGGNDSVWYGNMVKASDASLILKKELMETANKDYIDYQVYLTKLDAANFASEHPELALQLKEQELKAANELKALELKAQNEAKAAEDKINYATSNTKYFAMIGLAIIVIIGSVVAYFNYNKES